MKQLTQNRYPVLWIVVIAYAITLQLSCHNQSYASPEGYDMRAPQKMKLGKVLNEISGITYNTDNNTILAIADSKEKVFDLNVRNPKLKDYTHKVVPPNSDLEDIVMVDKTIYLLSSKGIIYEVQKNVTDTTAVQSYSFWSDQQNDFETLYFDPTSNGLIMVCKSCASDKGKQVRSAFRFDLQSHQFDSSVFYQIRTEDVRKNMKNDDVKFDPSAAAIHPLNKRLYILSSAGNILVIADTRGKVIEGFHLNPDDHPQAEGITFAPNGDMFISNEGKFGNPTLQKYSYQGKN